VSIGCFILRVAKNKLLIKNKRTGMLISP